MQSLGRWTRYQVVEGKAPTDAGGLLTDVDGDKDGDIISGSAWYRNPGNLNTMWQRFDYDPDNAAVHDQLMVDVNKDGRLDLVTMSDRNNLRWYTIPKDPTQRWVNHGFFNFQPVLFQDIAYANEYKWHMNFIGDRWARVAESAMDANGIKVDANTLEQIVMSPGWHGGGPLVVAAYEKTSDRPFSVPIQGGYHAAIEDRAQFSDYKLRE